MALKNARGAEQSSKMRKAQELGICPFCYEHLGEYHNAPIMEEGTFWVVTKNDYPYSGTSHHILFVTKEHIENPHELSAPAQLELFTLFAKITKSLGIRGGAFTMRFGEEELSGGTLPHLHLHLIVPKEVEGGCEEVVLFRIGSLPKKE